MHVGKSSWFLLAVGLVMGWWSLLPQTRQGDVVVFFQEFVLPAGESLEGDLVVFNGKAVIQEGARILGNVYMFGGKMVLEGQVQGRIVLMGGRVFLGATAQVQGTLTVLGGEVIQERGAYIARFHRPPGYQPYAKTQTPWMRLGDLAWRILTALLQGLALGLVALLVSIYFPQPLRRMGRVLREQAGMAFAVGASSLILIPLLSLLLAFTIIGLPLALMLSLGLQLLRYLAVLVLGHSIAHWAARKALFPWGEPIWNALGTTTAAWSLALLDALGCSGWLLKWALISLGLGAIWLSRFGTLER